MVTELSGRACAKINLFLRVTGRRGNGYHELDSVFLPVSLADDIRLEIRAADAPTVTVNCNLPDLARNQNNLVALAARSFMSEFDLIGDVSIDLEKRIPIGAGSCA
jgi:4-diphosphocytidyl-2-C-methyl-D-erythritol kinase